jgi:Starch-binding associating with outer membrane
MKKLILFTFTIIALVFTSCKDKFDEYAVNPNAPVQAPAGLVLNKLMTDLYNNGGGNDQRPWGDASKYSQFWCVNYNYYGNQDYGWTTTNLDFGTLYDVTKMEDEAKRNGAKDVNPYAALGKFFRAYFFVNMANRVGDVPMSEALKASSSVFKPKYDNQKDIFVQALKWLDEANSDLATLIGAGDKSLLGDFYFQNDLNKWRKIVNAYQLRTLIALSKRADTEGDMQIKQRFAAIISDAAKFPILTGMSDNLQYAYNSVQNKYPTNPDNFGFDATRNNMAETYIKTLTDLKDPRVFVVAEPADSMLRKGFKATDFEAYVGASSGEGLDDMSAKANKGMYSFINRKRYYSGYTAEPAILIGYVEQCFNIAEAINRGWITGNAEDFYKKGITASIKFYGISDANTEGYITQTDCKYKGNNADGLKQILTQKYLGFFQNSGWEAFYNQRRTGVPTFSVGAGNINSNRIPKRWQYPISERNNNSDSYKTAIDRQFAGKDDTNMDMWLIK